jgi:hypothetical protein
MTASTAGGKAATMGGGVASCASTAGSPDAASAPAANPAAL